MYIKETVEESSYTVKAKASVQPKGKKKNEKEPKDKNSPTNIKAPVVDNVDSVNSFKDISEKKKVGTQTQVWVAKAK